MGMDGRLETMNEVAEFLRDEAGASAVEYGLIASLIAIAIIAALVLMGGSLQNFLNSSSGQLVNVAGQS